MSEEPAQPHLEQRSVRRPEHRGWMGWNFRLLWSAWW